MLRKGFAGQIRANVKKTPTTDTLQKHQERYNEAKNEEIEYDNEVTRQKRYDNRVGQDKDALRNFEAQMMKAIEADAVWADQEVDKAPGAVSTSLVSQAEPRKQSELQDD